MLTIEQLRSQLGDRVANVPDEVLAKDLYDAYRPNMPFEQFAPTIGFNPNDNFVRGFKIAGRNTLGSVGGMVALGADMVGADGVKDAALGYANDQFNRAGQMGRRSDDIDTFFDNPGATLSAGFGQAVGYALPSVVTGGTGGLIGGLTVRGAGTAAVRAAATRGAILASGVNNVVQEAGSIYPDMIKEGHDDSLRALGFGTVAGALDTIPEAVGLEAVMNPHVRAAGLKGMTKAVAKGAVTQGTLGAATEISQSAIERAAAYKSVTDADAMHEYRNAGFLGALGDGSFGAAGGLRAKTKGLGNQTGQQDQPTPLLTNNPSPMLVFPDGSVAQSQQEIDSYLSQFNPEERAAVLRQLQGNGASSTVHGRMDTNAPTIEREYDMLDQEANRLRSEYNQLGQVADAYGQNQQIEQGISPQHGLFDYYQEEPTQRAERQIAPVPDGRGGFTYDVRYAPAPVAEQQGSPSREQIARDTLRQLGQISNDLFGGNHPGVIDIGTADGTFGGYGTLNIDENGNVVLRRAAHDEEHLLKGGKPATVQQMLDSSIYNGGAHESGAIHTSGRDDFHEGAYRDRGVMGTFRIPAAELIALAKQGKAILGNIGEGEVVLSGDVAQRYLSEINGQPVAALETNPAQRQLFDAQGNPSEQGFTMGGGVGKREFRTQAPPDLIAQQRLERAAGVPRQAAQPIALPEVPRAGNGQPLVTPTTPFLDRQLAARRKAANGELLTREEAALLTMPMPDNGSKVEVPRQSNARQQQGEMFPTAMQPNAAPAPAPKETAPVGPQPGQNELFDTKGQPTYGATPTATDEEVAAQFGKEFGLKPTPKRTPVMAKAGRLYYDGKADFEAVNQLAETLRAGKQAAAERTLNELVAAVQQQEMVQTAPAPQEKPVEQPAPKVDTAKAMEATREVLADAEHHVVNQEAAETSQAIEKASRTKDDIAAEMEANLARVKELKAQREGLTKKNDLPYADKKKQLKKIDDEIERLDDRNMDLYDEATGVNTNTTKDNNAQEAFDSDVFHSGEGPKYADLAPDLKKRWDSAVEANQANQDLHDKLSEAQKTADLAKSLTVMYRLAEPGQGSISFEAARTAARIIASRWQNAPAIEVVQKFSDLPAALRGYMEKANATNAKGVFWKGKVYAVSDNNSSAADVMATVLHETTGHFGLHGVLGERLSTVMRQIYNTNPEIRAIADEMIAAEKLPVDMAVEEVLADMAEHGEVAPSLLEKIANAIRQFLRSIGLGQFVSGVTNGEVKALLLKAREFVEYGDAPTDMHGEAAPAFRMPTEVPPPPASAGFVANLVDSISNIGTSSPVLGLMTMRQLADRFGKVPGVKTFTDLVTKMSVKAKTLQAEVAAIDHLWSQMKNDTDQRELMKLMLEATDRQMHIDLPFTDEANSHVDPVLRSDFDALAARYKALTERVPVAKQIYEQAREKFKKDWAETGKLIKQRIVEQYVPELGETLADKPLAEVAEMKDVDRIKFMAEMKTAAERRSLRSLWDDMDAHTHELSKMKGPYFPMMRFGDHVVTVKSEELIAAGQAYEDAKKALANLYQQEDDSYTADELKAAKKAVTKARAQLESLKADEEHYRVEFFEKRVEAKAREEQLAKFYADQGRSDMKVERSLREAYFRSMDSAPYGFMQKLEAAIKENLPSKDASAVEAAVRQLYIQSMPERSALKAQLRRLGTAGVKPGEMRRALVAAGLRNSFNISRLEFGTPMNDALGELRRGKTDEQKLLGAELAKRVLANMEQATSNRLIDGLSNMSYTTFLGLSPSFLLLNLTQPWTVSVPLLAARHSWTGAGSAMAKATAEVSRLMLASAKDQKTLWRFEADLSKIADVHERAMLDELFNRGIIDVTQEYDLGALAAGKDETLSAKLAKIASTPAHHTEVVNRIATALAAYRLEIEKHPGKFAEATSYAEKIVADSHLDYTAENAPRLLRGTTLGGLGKLVFQFKKYQQGMIFLTFKTMRDSYKNGQFDAEAFKSFVYLMGAQIGAAGIAATPFTGILAGGALIAGALGKDGEDKEFRERFYEGLKHTLGETGARLVMKGAPAALLNTDVSNRLGMGDVLNPLKYMQEGKTGQDWVAHALLALAGPAASMAASWADVLRTDNPAKATAAALPRFMAGPLKAMQMAEHGLETNRGNQYAKPEDLSAWDIASTAVGLKSTDMSDLSERRMALENAVQERNNARQAIIDKYSRARARGEDMTDLMQEIADWNERHTAPGERSVRITQSTLQKSVVAQRRYERDLRNGVRVRKQDRALAEDIGVVD